jgi:3-phosphoshikimate 1-carboxyvinyltransferase
MPLPDLIEIVPLEKPVHAEITVPGSKSITNRALVLAALADGEVTLRGALWSEDTQAMVVCLTKLGFELKVENDPEEFCNRTITVRGLGGKIPNGGTAENPLQLFVENAGTAARFLSAFVCLGNGVYRLSGITRMHERPQAALFKALRELGYRVESENGNDKLPVRIFGSGTKAGASCTVSIEHSSQFASALLLGAQIGGWNVKVIGENAEESPYVAMTTELIKVFPKQGGTFQIEPDASSGSYFLAAEYLAPASKSLEYSEQFGVDVPTETRSSITIIAWPISSWQMDEGFEEFLLFGPYFHKHRELKNIGKSLTPKDIEGIQEKAENTEVSRAEDLGDSIMTAIVLSSEENVTLSFDSDYLRFTNLGRLRVQECERVVALRTELTKCGAKVIEEGDTLTVFPSKLHGAEIETYNDHRMAMCFAILGLKIPGIKIKNPACVKKTFPNFFQKLAAPPPHGLGAKILDGSGKELSLEQLFAD